MREHKRYDVKGHAKANRSMPSRRRRAWLAGIGTGIFLAASAQGQGFVDAPVALVGDAAPVTGQETYTAVDFLPSIAPNGDVAFWASYDDAGGGGGLAGTGIFVDSGGADSALALPGQAAPGTGGGTYTGFSMGPTQNASADVAFRAGVTGGTASSGIFLVGSASVNLALEGESAPGTGTTGAYGNLSNAARVGVNAGGAGFHAPVVGSGVSVGVFRDTNAGPDSAVALEFGVAPGPGAGQYTLFTTDVGLSASGDLLFQASLSGPAGGGLFLETGGVVGAIALGGQLAPSPPGGVFSGFPTGNFALNDVGQIAFVAGVTDLPSPVEGIFQFSLGDFDTLVLSGETAPGTGGGTYGSLYLGDINNNGDVVFVADVEGGLATRGVFLRDASGTHHAVALAGQVAPGTGGGVYDTFVWSPSLNDSREIAFTSALAGGSTLAGVFRATPITAVPTVGVPGLLALAVSLMLLGLCVPALARRGPAG